MVFTPEVVFQLEHYVYRLIDPRNGETFYVGKGKGNRVFDHAAGSIKDDSGSNKLERIRRIKLRNLEVVHVIHRHGMDKETAFQVEAALIDAYPGLSNVAGGHGNNEFGSMHTTEIIEQYTAREMVIGHKILLISVNKSSAESSLYEATRYSWKLDKSRASRADYVAATVQGLCVGVFVATKWLKATPDNFPGRGAVEGRYGFVGIEAPAEIQNLYKGTRTPASYRKRGASNPIKYSFK